MKFFNGVFDIKKSLAKLTQLFTTRPAPATNEFIPKVTSMLEKYRELFQGDCPYVLNPTLSKKQVDQFESQAGIVLPPGYRDFLLHIGNGAAGTRPFPLSLSHVNNCLDAPVDAVSMGDVYRITGRLCGTVYSITR
ncbi:SMI1/KNR4 family protein [Paenibacillus lutrae]|uniref:Knr4/Smi1-like domain-containing protein n=1 Tax=Paenibacillus lutrae TaxID=2078573 RepID=A0A7X3FML8_9BACL|nr:SMI1/KNR4 family protein [Paenibacillus lutrae]MVP02057.1 hypothetical protein [Paenibacillus lutrae]